MNHLTTVSKPDIGYYVAELRHMACNAGMDVDDKTHLEQAADELEKHIPFASRADVETYLKGKGLRTKGKSIDGGGRWVTRGRKTQKAIIINENNTIDFYGPFDSTLLIEGFSISLLTPALLDKILEAK